MPETEQRAGGATDFTVVVRHGVVQVEDGEIDGQIDGRSMVNWYLIDDYCLYRSFEVILGGTPYLIYKKLSG